MFGLFSFDVTRVRGVEGLELDRGSKIIGESVEDYRIRIGICNKLSSEIRILLGFDMNFLERVIFRLYEYLRIGKITYTI